MSDVEQIKQEQERVLALLAGYDEALKAYEELGEREDWYRGETFEALRAARLKMQTEFLKVCGPSFARQYATLLTAHAEEAEAERDRLLALAEKWRGRAMVDRSYGHTVNASTYEKCINELEAVLGGQP